MEWIGRLRASVAPLAGQSGRNILAEDSTIQINCQEVWREISNYIDGDINPELRNRMRQHLEGCAHCTAILDGANNVIRLVADGRSFSLPAGFSERLRNRIARNKDGD
jgi:anti-sigma factor (TIGR02949 family)